MTQATVKGALPFHYNNVPPYPSSEGGGGSCGVPSKKERKKKKILKIGALYILSIVLLILGFSYIAVTLYQLFCQSTGFGGTIKKIENGLIPNSDLINNLYITPDFLQTQPPLLTGCIKEQKSNIKELTIYFNADVNNNLPWLFKPTINNLKIYPGDAALTFYTAQNISTESITGIATYHVTPVKVGLYFNKIQCFCFEEQKLKANEYIEMPILFYIDPEFINDPKMKDIDSITLSYTFFRSDFKL